jgi:hypothetical protein
MGGEIFSVAAAMSHKEQDDDEATYDVMCQNFPYE